jgi:pentose-5-phosphate-3-epimerase
MTGVALQPWYRAFGDHIVGGSVYAVKPELRVDAAVRLAAANCRVHADIILGLDNRHRGVSWDELAAIRRAAPTAKIDLHLIAPGSSTDTVGLAEERRAIETAVQIGAEFITVNNRCLSRHGSALTAARAAGTNLWLEVPPDEAGTDEQALTIDGLLVMLIEPGTKQAANLAHLEKVEYLAQTVPVAVDGGVTRKIAAKCLQLGARYAISGRDLLTVIRPPLENIEKG